MTSLQTMKAFFAGSPKRQISALPELPFDKGARGFYEGFNYKGFNHNPLLILLDAFQEESWHQDYEPWEIFLARTGIPDNFNIATSTYAELRCLIYLVENSFSGRAGSLLTQKGLEREVEWRLVRRLSQITLDELSWEYSFENEALDTIIKDFERQKEF
jgi:hypothetical protein